MNIILTGMRGTGKSSIGRLLAGRFNYAFVDTDAVVEMLAGTRIANVVARYGWEHFRALEQQAVARAAGTDRQVIATGGGTLIDAENAERLKACGIVVLLVCDIPILQRRIRGGTNRPSLTGQRSATDELAQVWETRRVRYLAVADLTYDVSAESADSQTDLQRKAAALQTLLLQTPKFHQYSATPQVQAIRRT
jgi:shikimate kinase